MSDFGVDPETGKAFLDEDYLATLDEQCPIDHLDEADEGSDDKVVRALAGALRTIPETAEADPVTFDDEEMASGLAEMIGDPNAALAEFDDWARERD